MLNPAVSHSPHIHQGSSAPLRKKKRTLHKCFQCRRDKQACLPPDRVWPEKCNRCTENGHKCSEGQRAPIRKRPTLSPVSTAVTRSLDFKLPRLAEKRPTLVRHDLDPRHVLPISSTPANGEAIHLLTLREVTKMALVELGILANDLEKPFVHDPRFAHPKEFMPNLDRIVEEFISFDRNLESLMLQLNAGEILSYAQSALDNVYYRQESALIFNRRALEEVQESIVRWYRSEHSGLAHILQIKLIQKHPNMAIQEIGRFGLSQRRFLDAAVGLLGRLNFKVPKTIELSQSFMPCKLARISAIASHLCYHRTLDCLGRSVAQILSDAGSSPNWLATDIINHDILGRTALQLACRDGDKDGVKALLDAGAQVDTRAVNGLSSLHIAAISGDSAICSMLWSQWTKINGSASYDQRILDAFGRSPLMWAAFFGHLETVNLFQGSRSSAVATSSDSYGCTAIGLAALRGHVNVVDYLIRRGLSSDAPDSAGRSPFWCAARGSHCDIMQLLDLTGAHIDRKDNEGLTPLAVAAREGHTNAVEQLLSMNIYDSLLRDWPDARVDINAENNMGLSPLVLAASARRAKCVAALLRHGSDLLSNDSIEQALEVAQKNNDDGIVKLLQPYRFTVSHYAWPQSYVDINLN